MSSIDNLKTLLEGNVKAGSRNLSVYVNETNTTEKNCIRLFYNNDNSNVAGERSRAPYYKIGIQVTVRHIIYNTARNCTFTALEYINDNRKTIKGAYWIPDGTPTYLGQDESNNCYVWAFDLYIKGAK